MTDIIRELRDDYPAVDVTEVVFSRDFAGIGCCVIPQEKVLETISRIEALEKALADLLAYEKEAAQFSGFSDCTCMRHSMAFERAYEAGQCPHHLAQKALSGAVGNAREGS